MRVVISRTSGEKDALFNYFTNMSSPIRFGFIGAGQIAEISVASVKSHANGRIVAIQDVNPERAQALAGKHAIEKTYATPQELFADPEVDAVYVAVPNKFHVPLTIEALKAGKHVMLEKPFAMNYAEALEAAEVARASGKVLTLGMNLRFGAMQQKMKMLAEEGAFGEIYHAKALWQRRVGIPKLGTWFGSRELAGGGCLYDIGVHLLDLCLFVTGKFNPASVMGATYTKFGNRGKGEGGWGRSDRTGIGFDVEDFASGLIRFADGSTVSLDVTWACHTDSPSRMDVQLFGTEAGAHVLGGKTFVQDENTGEYLTREVTPGTVPFAHQERFHNFINHLHGTEDLCVTLEQALVVQHILDAIAESSATGREVRFDS